MSRLEAGRTPVPLRRVYLLRHGEGAPRTEALTGLEAVTALVDETYFLSSAAALKLTEQCFRLAATAARTVQVRRLVRPYGLQYLDEVVGLIDSETRRS